MDEFGTINIKLNQLLKDNKISKKKIKARAHMQTTQFNRYCNNEVERIDKNVLARMCSAFGCGVQDILEFIPPKNEERDRV